MAEESPKRATVTNNADGPRWLHTATGPLMLLAGASHEDYFSEAEIKSMRATGLMDVELAKGKAAAEAAENAPELGPHARLARGVPGAKDRTRRKRPKMK